MADRDAFETSGVFVSRQMAFAAMVAANLLCGCSPIFDAINQSRSCPAYSEEFRINSTPQGARITFDGRFIGTTPTAVPISGQRRNDCFRKGSCLIDPDICPPLECKCNPMYSEHDVRLSLSGIDIQQAGKSGVWVDFPKEAYQLGKEEMGKGNLGMAKFYFEKVRDMGLAESKEAIRDLEAMQRGK